MRMLLLDWRDPLGPDAGGAERYILRLAQVWAADGHQVTILVPRSSCLPAHEVRDGVEFVRVGGRHTVFPAARRYLRRHGHRYDCVVESVSTRPFFAHHVVGRRAFAIYHQMAIDVWNAEFRPPVSWLGRYVVERHWARRMRDAQVMAVSPSTERDLTAHGINVIAVAPFGRDACPAPIGRRTLNACPRVLFVGRLVRQKRPDEAVAAFRLVRRRFPEARLDVLGDGYLRPGLSRLCEPGVYLHGFVTENEKARYLKNADVMLIPATREGWGIIALEAAAHGIPVVAYNVGGLRDSVLHMRTGLLCAPNPSAAADAAVRLLSNPSVWQGMSDEARNWAWQFSWERTASGVLDVLASRLAQTKARAA